MNISASLKLAFGVMLVAIAPLVATQIDSGITGRGPAAVRLAIPEFRVTAPGERGETLTKVFNETLWADLDFTGILELAPRSFYPLGVFALPGDIRVEDWTRPGVQAQYVAYGPVISGNNRWTVTGRLRDLGAPQDSFASNFSFVDEQTARLAAHNYADRIFEQLGLGRGISRTQITFVSDRSGHKEIYVMDYDGSSQHRLTSTELAITPNWSPVDDRIVYTEYPGPRIAIVAASGQRHSFTQPSGVTNAIPSWSPDGKSILYTSRRDGNTEIYVADADGRNARRLTTSPGIDTSPVFNPVTGRRIAFVSNRSGSPQIYTMSSDGTDILRITEEGGDAENPAYSPDGKMIAFAWQKPRSGGFDIFLYEIATQRFHQLTSNAGNNERPTWAPDGVHIAFQSNRTGNTQIYSMTVDGKKLIQLTRTGSNEGPSWSGYATQ